MHIVHFSRSTFTSPYGAPAGSAISATGRGASFARCSTANSMDVRLSFESWNVAGAGASGAL
jgi:hypothetical protein